MSWFKKSRIADEVVLTVPKSDSEFATFLNTVMKVTSERAPTEQDFYWFLIEIYDFLANLEGTEDILLGFQLYDLEYRGSKSEDSYPGKRNEAATYVRDQVMGALRSHYPERDASVLLALTYVIIAGQNHDSISKLRVKYASHYRDNCLQSGSFGTAEKWEQIIEAAENQTIRIAPFEGLVPWTKRAEENKSSTKREHTSTEKSDNPVNMERSDTIAPGLCKIISNYGSAQVTESRSILSDNTSRHISGLIDGLKFTGIIYDADSKRKIPAVSVHLRADINHLKLTDEHIAFWNADNRFSKMHRQDSNHAFLTLDAFITEEDEGRIAHSVVKIWSLAINELPKLRSSYD